ncbi:acetyl-CoA acetyltransferase [Anaerobacillus alkalidiazotrophicus]|uniref:Acetyl-CoA acetyltransferase n=1 Tax=Anaerobacillus alkalidiazotrophicus TaxID=472963 RepID=A0A1S2M879_9BACI|nr:thiolase family protein [Anaerobacillus alkalidiazotrophicus]OIJ18572.1 acetyl-CoA acetyltransferase [Anaerobacillus alkalidiazotrophicus]OIJ20017.1 acetyl-CoA acetyltransferase [Anaerobacillus alkalidiazotrophicus]
MREAVIVQAVRTPIGRRNGILSSIRPDEMLSLVLSEVVKRAGISKKEIDDVICGCVTQCSEQAANIARIAALIAGFPKEVPGVTIDRQCGSSEQAIHFAAQAILSGDMDVVIASGVESMSRVPMFSQFQGRKESKRLSDQYEMVHQGLSAERIADNWNLSRQQLDEFALSSHQKAIRAREKFKQEMMPLDIEVNGEKHRVTEDEGPRDNTSLAKLSNLKTPFLENGRITAGNASQISDGAAAILIMSKEKALQLGVKGKFRIVARTVVGSDPTLMLTGPIFATKKVLQKAGLTLKDIDLFEINEAFASVPLVCEKELGINRDKINVNGGAIALGHPLGATGARMMTTLCHELERSGLRYGLTAICEGYGMANATIIERIK